MADASDLKSLARKGVRVRVPPSAPLHDGILDLAYWMVYFFEI